MIQRQYAQLTLAQVVLYGVIVEPEALMEPALRRIDDALNDERLVDEVLEVLKHRRPQSAGRGRPGTPAEVVLRMLVLKHYKAWTYADLQWEVTGNLVYRRFCRIDGERVPHAKTMVRLGQLLDGNALHRLLEHITTIGIERGVTRGRKMRVDTTVVEAAIRYPTDSGLCQDVVRVLGRATTRLAEAGVKLSFVLRRVGRSVSRRLSEIGQALRLRGDATKQALVKPYRGLLRITGRLIRQATQAVVNAQQQSEKLPEAARRTVARLVTELETMLPRARQVVRQTRDRIFRGITDSAAKIISIFEPHAQILRRGKLHKPTEFGMLVKVQEAEGGLVTDVALVPEKADAPLLVPSVERHIELFGHPPQVVATDRGFFSTEGERRLVELGVKHPVIPKPGYRSAKRIQHERQRWFRRARAWRAGGEARISRLKNHFGMTRSPYRGKSGLARTVYWAAISNNLAAIATRSR